MAACFADRIQLNEYCVVYLQDCISFNSYKTLHSLLKEHRCGTGYSCETSESFSPDREPSVGQQQISTKALSYLPLCKVHLNLQFNVCVRELELRL